jgi:hypothetical protein
MRRVRDQEQARVSPSLSFDHAPSFQPRAPGLETRWEVTCTYLVAAALSAADLVVHSAGNGRSGPALSRPCSRLQYLQLSWVEPGWLEGLPAHLSVSISGSSTLKMRNHSSNRSRTDLSRSPSWSGSTSKGLDSVDCRVTSPRMRRRRAAFGGTWRTYSLRLRRE